MTDDDGAEDLPQPQRRSNVRRLRLDIALGALVLAGIVLVTRDHGKPGAAGETSSPAPSASTAQSETPHSLGQDTLAVYPVPDRQAGNAARCPAGFDCPVSNHISAGARAALQAAFPGARVLHARTVRAIVVNFGQAVWTIDVRARIGDQLLRLRLQPASPTDRERHGTTVFGGHAITHWESLLSQLVVVIDVVAPADEPASLPAIEQLARDARLTSPW